MHALAQAPTQAVVRLQLRRGAWLAVAGDVGRAGAQHAAVGGRQRKGHEAGIRRFSVANGVVHRILHQVGKAIAQPQFQLQSGSGLRGDEILDPAPQVLATDIAGQAHAQPAAERLPVPRRVAQGSLAVFP